MKIEELKKLDKKSIEKKLADISNKLVSLNVKKTMGGLDKPHELKVLKKERAQLKTVLSFK